VEIENKFNFTWFTALAFDFQVLMV